MASRFDGSYWLAPWEQEETIEQLLRGGLLKWDNTGALSLPLKSGGMTDIYVNMRDVRNCPATLTCLAEIYANTMRRLRVDRMMDIPDGISPVVAVASALTDIPMVTIRPEAKTGRVVSGKLIGKIERDESVAAVDDVATDAASKVPAINEIRKAGAKLAAVVALVDRQGGWQKQLDELGLGDAPFWFGMTLHDIRRYLIEKGLMRRCDPKVEASNPLILALDGKSWDEFVPFLVKIRGAGCILKVNDLLFNKGIEWLLPNLSVYGRIMADLKGHDIKNTLENVCKHLRACPPWAVTIHASGGSDMVGAVVNALEGTPTIALCVTLLTSIDPKTCEEIYTSQPIEVVLKLAKLAWNAGARGFVCSGEEVGVLSAKYPEGKFVVPGLRSSGVNTNEQKRTATFEGAKEAGANFFVGGRQFFGAQNPVDEVKRVLAEELKVA